jgi:hypothetical protein
MTDLEQGLKYLGFFLKPNQYKKCDWQWLIAKVEKKINTWCNRWLSRGGHLVLVKAVWKQFQSTGYACLGPKRCFGNH